MTAALILAAGAPFGAESPITDVGHASSIRRQILTFQQAGIDRIVVVTGHGAEKIERHCAHMGVVFLYNADYADSDMLGSIKIGLEHLKQRCDRAFVTPADVPLFSAATLLRMSDADAPLVVPSYGGSEGHPLLVASRLFGDVLAYDGSGGLKTALSGAERSVVAVEDKGVLVDLSGGDDFGDLIETHSLRALRPEIKVWLAAEHGFFGPGTYQLLSLTTETGSLKESCRQMGISYSKGWKVVASVEKYVGYEIISSRQGGKTGGTTEVTERGLELVRRYEAFAAECHASAREIFARHFGDMRNDI